MSKVLIMTDGTEIPVVKDSGRYWVCKEAQYKKSNPAIADVKEKKTKKAEEVKGE